MTTKESISPGGSDRRVEYREPSETIRVLHVDDDSDLLSVTARFLEREGDDLAVSTETNVEDALDSLEAGDVDCIVSDYQMPGTDGLEFLDRVRETHPDLPFVLYTGKGSEEIASEAISRGVTDYLQKEAATDQYAVLANRIENVVDQHRGRQQVERGFRAMESAREGISILDEDGRFVFVNDAYTDIVGYDRSELLGRHWELLYPAENVDAVREEILPAVPTEGRWTGETVYVRGDGRRILVDHALAYADDGTLICLVRDVTRATDETPLVTEDAFVDSVLDALQDVFYVLDADGSIVRVNDREVETTGFTADELADMDATDVVADEDAAAVEAAIAETLETGQSTVEASLVTKSGETVPHEFRTRRLTDPTGENIGLVGIGRDVSRRRRRERRLERQAAQFEAFGSVLSHDLRNPLTVLQARLDLLTESLPAESGPDRDDAVHEHVSTMTRTLDRLETLVDDLATAMKEGDIASDPEPVAITAAARAAWGALETGDATLVVETDASILADGAALERLFDNLLRNAVEHAGPDVSVTVGTLENGFYVADDGPGVPEEARDDVFDPGVSGTDEGSGFGLASVRQIALAHGWEVALGDADASAVPDGNAAVPATGSDGHTGARFEIRDVAFVE